MKGKGISADETDNVYRTVLEAIPRCSGVRQLYAHVYERFGLPIILTDISYHLLAYGGPEPCPDPYWQTIIETGTAAPEVVIDGYYKDGYMDRLSDQKEPFKVDWGISKDMPQTTCGVLVDGKPDAITSVLYITPENEALALELNAALRTAAEVYLAGKKGQEYSAPERAYVAKILLEDTTSPLSLLKNTAFFREENIIPKYVILALSLREPVSGRLQNLRSSIKSHYPRMIYSNQEDAILLFFRSIQSREAIRVILETIREEAAGKADYVCGVSDVFDDLEKRSLYVEQARLSMQYGLLDAVGGSTYLFSQYYSEILAANGTRNLLPENLICPELKTLLESDRQNSTNYYESLRCYLFSLCDMSKTAAKLFIHRNSAMYRIKRCQEIMGVELTDQDTFERLYIGCRIIEHRKAAEAN